MRTLLLSLALGIAASASAEMPSDVRPDPLEKKITLPVGKDTFQRRMEFIAKETGATITIDKTSLQTLGITRNQRTVVSAEMADTPAIALIVALCRQIENTANTVEMCRADDGSVTITARKSP